MSIVVLKPGMLSTIQDEGRWQYQGLGVGVSGAMDPSALRLANILVGNPSILPCLEITLTGPSLRFDSNACIAITGAFLSPHIDDEPIQNNRSYILTPGQTLSFKSSAYNTGARAYIAVFGGFKGENTLNSHSTDLKSKLGGIQGRPLQKDDILELNGRFRSRHILEIKQFIASRSVYLTSGLGIQPRQNLRIIPGTHFAQFTQEARHQLLDTEFKISAQSDRMGYRLQGCTLSLQQAFQIYSEPTAFGTIQVPPDGNPIVLMADRQSTGGYPKIANVITADLGYLAQALPGQSIRFTLTSVEEAQTIWAERMARFKQLQAQLRDTV
ncbi:MAG: biotin-dependent carboxyltransferase family protein, partial [Pelistega sp.]|nr:biotin-dependent carboxyltransferase family protein [Pelistega sp.]